MRLPHAVITALCALMLSPGLLRAALPPPDQPGVTKTFVSSVTITLANHVPNATSYRIYISTDNEMSYQFYTAIATSAIPYTFYYQCPRPTWPSGNAITAIGRSTTSVAISWQPAQNPPSTTVFVRLSASSTVNGESPLSLSPANSAILSPRVISYSVWGISPVTVVPAVSAYTTPPLTPNEVVNLSLYAYADDEQISNSYVLPPIHAAAAQISPAFVFTTSTWNQQYGLTNTVAITGSVNPNPSGTAFAIRVTSNTLDGTEQWLSTENYQLYSTPVWDSQTSWTVFPATWTHVGLTANTTYYYDIFARNNDGVINPQYQRFSILTPNILISELENLSCHTAVSETFTSMPANDPQPTFSWRIKSSTPAIASFNIYWSRSDNPNIVYSTTPWAVVIASTAFPSQASGALCQWTTTVFDPTQLQDCFFKVRALDVNGRYSGAKEFVYRFDPDHTAPAVHAANVITNKGAFYANTFFGLPLDGVISVPFTEEMATATINASTINLTMIRNGQGTVTNTPVAPTVRYFTGKTSPFISEATACISASFLPNAVYELVVTTMCTDQVGNPLSKEYRTEIHTTITTPDTDTVIMLDRSQTEHAEVTIPAGTIPANSYVVYSAHPDTLPAVISAAAIPAANRKSSAQAPVWYFECELYDTANTRRAEALYHPVTVTMTYTDNTKAGFVDGTNTPVDELCIWTLNEERNYWMKLPTSIVDKTRRIVRATTTHLGTFALMGTLTLAVGEVKCFPVPWAPTSGKTQSGNLTDGITFIGMPQQGDLYIYTIKGDLVRHILINDPLSFQVQWDGKNDDNSDVASGVYLWVVKSTEGSKTGKLIVIR